MDDDKRTKLLASVKALLKPYPENRLGLTNGSLLECAHPAVTQQLGIPMGVPIPIGWDGESVRSGPFTWDAEQICEEVDGGFWKVLDKKVDFDDARQLFQFLVVCIGAEQELEKILKAALEDVQKGGRNPGGEQDAPAA